MKTMNAHYFLWTIFFAICAEVQNVKDTLSGSPDADLKSGNESPTLDPVLESALMTRIEGKSVYLYHRSYTRVVAGEEGPHGWWNDADENGNAAFNATLARPQRRGLPSSNETTVKPDIRIGVLLPFSRNMQHVVTKVAPILEYAVDKVALQMGPWAFNSLTLLYADSMCDIAEAMNKAIQLEERLKTVAFFGPVCDYAFAPVARQAKFWNTPLVTVGGTALDFIFLKTTTYPTTTRVGVISINGALELIKAISEISYWGRLKFLYNSTGQDDKSIGFCHFVAEFYDHMFRTSPINADYYKIDSGITMSVGDLLKSEVSTEYAGKYVVFYNRFQNSNTEC